MKYESPTFNGSQVIANDKVLRYVGQRSRSKSQEQKIWYERKGIITKNEHVTYKSPTHVSLLQK